MNILIIELEPLKNNKYKLNNKYTNIDFINGIIEIINNNTFWSRYNGKIDGNYLNKKHNYYCCLGVYYYLYKIILLLYLKKTSSLN